MSKILQFLRQNWIYLVPVILLIIFVGSILDRNYYFGGDLLLPIDPQDSIIRSIYLWEEQNGGSTFFKYVLSLWQGFFYILSLIKIPSDIAIKIFVTSIYILGFTFSYLFYRELFKEKKWGTTTFALVFALFYILNPAAVLVVVGTLELYAFPICFYFLIKYLDTKNILYSIPFAFVLNISFFPGLPQAKPLIVFFIATFFLLIIYFLLRDVKVKRLVLSLSKLVCLTILLNAFVFLPFLNDSFGGSGFYKQYTSSVITYNGDADLYSAAIPFTTRLYNSNLVDKYSRLGHFLADPLFISWTFALFAISLVSLFSVKEKKDKYFIYICLLAFLVLVFISKGANLPFGEIYRWSLSHIPIAKLFRTTSTSIIGGVIFYTILLTISTYFISRKWKVALPIIVIVNVIVLHGIYLGFKLDNPSQRDQKGITIPKEYFAMGNLLDSLKQDGKILVLPFNDGYVSKTWSYTGQSLIPWLTKKPVISRELATISNVDSHSFSELCSFTSLYNVRYILLEKDFQDREIKKDLNFKGKNILENSFFKLQETNDSCFLPHFYSSTNSVYFKGQLQNIYNLSYLPVGKDSFILTNNELDIKKQEETEKKLMDAADHIVIETAPDYVNGYIPRGSTLPLTIGEDAMIGKIIYPYVSIRSNSILYPLIVWKEDNELNNQSLFKRQLLDLHLLFASKRIKEIEEWGIDNKTWQSSQDRFKKLIEGAIETAVTSGENRENLELVYEYLLGFKKDLVDMRAVASYKDKKMLQQWIDLIESLEEKTENRFYNPNFNNLIYNASVPSSGDYKAYLLLDKGRLIDDNSVDLKVSLADTQLANYSKKQIENKTILDLGIFNLKEKNNKITIDFSNREGLIDSSRWKSVEPQSVILDSNEILFSPSLKMELQGASRNYLIYQKIKKWMPGATYLLRIRHNEAEGSIFNLRISEKKTVYNRNNDSWNTIDQDIVNKNIKPKVNGGEFRMVITPDKNATEASMYISGQKGMVKIESVTLERVLIPQLYFINQKNDHKNIANEKTTVKFTKVNPTKYKVTINNMTTSSHLVFSETFDRGWKIYKKNGDYISENQHFLANGYANAWHITSQEGDLKKQNEFIIEYISQRVFYIGQIISLITLLVCICLYVYSKVRRIIRK